jgi:hypothetical protein
VRRAGVDHADLLASRLACERLVERSNGCLRRPIGGHSWEILFGDHSGDVDDHTALVDNDVEPLSVARHERECVTSLGQDRCDR